MVLEGTDVLRFHSRFSCRRDDSESREARTSLASARSEAGRQYEEVLRWIWALQVARRSSAPRARAWGAPARWNSPRAGCRVVVNGRDAIRLEATAAEIRAATGAEVIAVAGDLGDARVREALLAACPAPDILVNNNGGPPRAEFETITREQISARARGQHADADRAGPARGAGHGRAPISGASSTSLRPRCARRSPASTFPRARAPA